MVDISSVELVGRIGSLNGIVMRHILHIDMTGSDEIEGSTAMYIINRLACDGDIMSIKVFKKLFVDYESIHAKLAEQKIVIDVMCTREIDEPIPFTIL